MKRITAIILTAAMLVGTAALTACSKDENGNGQSSQQSKVSQVSKDASAEESKEEVKDISAVEEKKELSASNLNEINAFIEKYKGIPDFSSESDVISAREISKDKAITLIPDNSNYSFTSLVTEQFVSAAASAGFKNVIANESNATASFYNDELEKSIEKSNIVVMYGDIDKDPIAAEIEKTQANGIRVLSAGNVGKDQKDHYVDHTIPINYQLAGKLLADWTISANKGKVNALAINNSDSMLSSSVYKGFADEFQKYVVSGYCSVLSGSSIEIDNGLSAKIKQAIDKDPNINYVVVLDDAMINDAVSGVDQSGKKIKIISTGGSLAAFDAAQSDRIEMLVAQSYEWTAYAMVDYALRVLNGSALPQEQDVPVRVVTSKSINEDLENNTYSNIEGFYEICFGANFVTGYSGLWNL